MAAAKVLGKNALDKECFFDKKVLITGEKDVLMTGNGRECFLNSIRLIIKFNRNLTILIPSGVDIEKEARELINQIKSNDVLVNIVDDANLQEYDSILSIGVSGKKDLPWTVINSNGWLARIASTGNSLPVDCSLYNPIGSLAAASLGASEIFKRIAKIVPCRGELIEQLSFSFFSYSSSNDPGPLISCVNISNTAIIGAGSIGNGLIYLLNHLPITGSALLVDNQRFEEGNLGTCILIGPKEIGIPKIELATRFRQGSLCIKGFCESVAEFKKRVGAEISYPKIILGAVDNIPARREIQNFWPDLIIDGAMGEFACQVGLHPIEVDASCLLCDFEEPSEKAEKAQSELTGLSELRILDSSSCVTIEDIENAPREKKDWLKKHVGEEVCSVISAATIEKISTEKFQENFRPAIPFVACLSACMIIAELIKYIYKLPTVKYGFKFDCLVGPQYGSVISHQRKRSCVCVQRQGNIRILRRGRGLD